MKHPWILPLLLLVAACGGGLDSPEGVMDAHIKAMNDAADVLKTIKDKSSAEAVKPKLEAIGKRMKENEAAMSKVMGEPDMALAQKKSAEMAKAMSNFMSAMAGLPDDPEVQRIVDSAGIGG